MAICAKCGQEVGGFAGLQSHSCVQRQLSQDEIKRANEKIRVRQQQEQQRLAPF